MRRFRIPQVLSRDTRVELDEAASHHLLVVCRHPRNAPLVLFDADGWEAEARLDRVDGGRAFVTITSHRRRVATTSVRHLVLCLPKGPAVDRALRMATELGVTHVHPAVSERTVAKGERRDRWLRIIESACQQCGRNVPPELLPLAALTDALTAIPKDIDRFLALPASSPATGARGTAHALAVGPEGGLSESEVRLALAEGWEALNLGPWVLRTDTAVAAGLAYLLSVEPT